MKEISRILYNRGLHRSFGDASLGTIAAFLTFVFLIRAAVNLYFVFNISSGRAIMDIHQISAGWFLQISLYIILCSSLSAFHLSFALPEICFIDMSENGSLFRNRFLVHAAVLRPMNILILILISTGFLVFGSASEDNIFIFYGLFLVAISVLVSTLAFKAAYHISPGKLEIQILEAGFLFLLVIINPDVIRRDDVVSFLYQGNLIRFEKPQILLTVIIFAFIILIILLFILKAVSLLNSRVKTGFVFKPMTGWYIRYFKINYWFLMYMLALPILLLPVFGTSIKIQASIVFILFNLLSFLIFLNKCDHSLKEKWQTGFLSGNNLIIFVHPLILHSALTLFPIVLFLITRNRIGEI